MNSRIVALKSLGFITTAEVIGPVPELGKTDSVLVILSEGLCMPVMQMNYRQGSKLKISSASLIGVMMIEILPFAEVVHVAF